MPTDDLLPDGSSSADAEPMPMASPDLLERTRRVAVRSVLLAGGSQEEAELVANEVVWYADSNWLSLDLHRLAVDDSIWERHIERTALRLWLAKLRGVVRSRWADPGADDQADAVRRLLTIIDSVDLDSNERRVFDSIYVFGFSVKETAARFGMTRTELVDLLRRSWQHIRGQSGSAEE